MARSGKFTKQLYRVSGLFSSATIFLLNNIHLAGTC